MGDWRWRCKEKKDETVPPFSRIFVVCCKHFKEEDLRGPFENFGFIDNFYMPKDQQTGESKGVAYIKYTSTLAAATAIKEMNQKCIGNSDKPLKVMVANHKNDKNRTTDESKCTRLFIIITPTDTEQTIEDHFSTFGELNSVYIHKNGKFAFVSYKTFYDTAKAYEQCDLKYKGVFAAPREELKRGRDNGEPIMGSPSMSSCSLNNGDKILDSSYLNNHANEKPMSDHQGGPQKICVSVTPLLPEKYIRSLFNIIPGMEDFQISHDHYNNCTKAIITYGDQNSAACAVDRLNEFQFPSGETVFVKLEENPIAKAATEISNMVNSLKSALDAGNNSLGLVKLADCIAQASSLIQVATTSVNEPDPLFCSVRLPPVQPLATTRLVAKRCFIVCQPEPPSQEALNDAFCRFGDLIDVKTFPHRTFGFVKYASEKAAEEAIKTLHMAKVCGVTLKVMEANNRYTSNDSNVDRKRLRLDIE